MKRLLYIIPILLLSACTSPAANMTPMQISNLSNQQLCQLQWNYSYDQNTELEIGKRNLNCDPIYNECLNKGMQAGTPQISMCMNEIREKKALEAKIQQQELQLSNERAKNNLRLQQDAYNGRMAQQNLNANQRQRQQSSGFCPGFPFCN